MKKFPFEKPKCIPRSSYNKELRSGGFLFTIPGGIGTQKARGIFFLMQRADRVSSEFNWNVPKHILFKSGVEFSEKSFNYPVFARPCPTVPRHGFVDSIVCKTHEELNKLSKETSSVEDGSELLVTKPVDAQYNAIINDGVITFSTGNDGATSGKNCKYFYIGEDVLSKAISLDQELLLPNEVPFYELVIGKDRVVHLVQVRSAPGVPRVKDYVPNPVEVKQIIKAEGDLLEWEEKLKKVDPKTTIIDHTDGSLSSHYAIHAIVNQIPIFTSWLPKLGDKVEATVVDTEINDKDRQKFYDAFCYGFMATPDVIAALGRPNTSNFVLEVVQTALATLHNFSAIAMNKDYEVLGIVLGLFVRSIFAISVGEARFGMADGRVTLEPEKTKVFKDFFANFKQKSREHCYNTVMTKDAGKAIENVKNAYYMFRDFRWSCSFGGPKWRSCTTSAIDLFNACVNRDIMSVVEKFNRVINEEHNGGKYLNKVINVYDFDLAAQNASKYALSNFSTIVSMLTEAWNSAKKNKDLAEVFGAMFEPITLKSAKELYGVADEKTEAVKTKKPLKDIFANSATSPEAPKVSASLLKIDKLYLHYGGIEDITVLSIIGEMIKSDGKHVPNANFAISVPPGTISAPTDIFGWNSSSKIVQELTSEPNWWKYYGIEVISKVKINKLVKEYLANNPELVKTL